jgi:PAS domain S-box-containing protein
MVLKSLVLLFSTGDKTFDAEEIALLERQQMTFHLLWNYRQRKKRRKKPKQYMIAKKISCTDRGFSSGDFRTDETGYTTYVNSRWCEISGISFQNAIGNGWLNAVHPDDRNILFEDWNVAASNEEISVSEYRFLKPDGQIVWVMGQATMENSENQVVGYVGTITDITDRKLAEQEFIK